MKVIFDRIQYLRNLLNNYNYFYYIKNKSIISDLKYDTLMQELINLENKYPECIVSESPTKIIGYKNFYSFEKVNHQIPMLSLNNVFDKKNYLHFHNKIKNLVKKPIYYCCEMKFDGLAVNLLYKKGKLVQAATRGDGKFGENITNNIYEVKSIPLYLKTQYIPKIIEIRGEIFMKKSIFYKLNSTSLSFNNKKFSNLRNAAAGSIRHSNPKITNSRKLSFFCYGFGNIEGYKMPDSHFSCLNLLHSWGLPINKNIFLYKNTKDILHFYYSIQSKRSNFDFNIDGIVIKVDSLSLQKKLGYVHRAPKWAIAFKFKSQEAITYIKNISFQVGRTGLITPIAHLHPIIIEGTKIKNATLHNFNEIKRLNLKIGDYVIISKAGDVIPKIISVVFNKRKKNLIKINFPNKCPICKSHVQYIENKSLARCSGEINCNAQLKKSLYHFVSRSAFNMIGIGYTLINKLVDAKYVKNFFDLFILDIKKLICINGIGMKLANKLLFSIKRAKKISLSKFLYSLGIHEIGESTSYILEKNFLTLENIVNAKIKDFLKIPGIGLKKSHSIYYFIKKNNNLISNLNNVITIISKNNFNKKNKIFTNNQFYNKNVTFSGKLYHFKRNDIKKILFNFGAKVKNTVSKNIDFFIIGNNPSALKIIKAKKFNIKIIKEKEFLNFLGRAGFEPATN